MTRPDTYFETHGDFSPLSAEDALLQHISTDVDATTPVQVHEIGRSVDNNPLWRVTLGNPAGPAVFVAGSQHGREVAGREGALIWLRDLAYATDTATLDFLAKFRVVVVPNCNPDGTIPPRERNNRNGENLNRVWVSLTEPEVRAVAQVITEVDPLVISDLHGWGSSHDFIFAYYGAAAGNYPATDRMIPLVQQYESHVVAAVENDGYTTRPYPGSVTAAEGYLTSYASMVDALGFLTETRTNTGTPELEVGSQRSYLGAMMDWLSDEGNLDDLEDAKAQNRSDNLTGDSPIFLPSIDNGELGAWQTIPDPGEYVIPDRYEIPEKLLALHGIVVEGRTVSTRQRARKLIPALFDENSYYYFARQGWGRLAGDRFSSPFGVVKQNGVRYPIQSLVVKQNGVRYPVQGLVVKQGGTRHPVG